MLLEGCCWARRRRASSKAELLEGLAAVLIAEGIVGVEPVADRDDVEVEDLGGVRASDENLTLGSQRLDEAGFRLVGT